MDNKTLAIIALVLAIFSLISGRIVGILAILFPIAGLIVGIVALNRIKKYGGEGKGFAIAAIIICAIFITLSILTSIGALVYFKTMQPEKFVPSKCQLPADIACEDFKIDSKSGIRVILRNGLGFDLKDITFTVSGCTSSSSQSSMLDGERKTFTATGCSLTKGEKYSGEINIKYTNTATNLQHEVRGLISGRTG